MGLISRIVPKYTGITYNLDNIGFNKIKFHSTKGDTSKVRQGSWRYTQIPLFTQTHRIQARGFEAKMSSFVKACSFCGFAIQMSDKNGRWMAFNEDGSVHNCRGRNQRK